MRPEYKGCTSIVTGAGRGIGRAIASALATEGMNVAAAARSEDQLRSLALESEDSRGRIVPIPTDISSEKQIIALFERTEKLIGVPRVLINNAGVGLYGPVAECTSEELDQMLSVNLRGTFLCCREAIKAMSPEGGGYIINIGSLLGFKGYPRQAGYTATKHGIMGLTKALAKEAQKQKIRVSVINPGGVDTEMVRKSRPDLDPSVLIKPEDVAQAVLYLLSLSERAAIDHLYLRRNAGTPF